MNSHYQELQNVVIDSGRLLLSYFGDNKVQVEYKDADYKDIASIVTKADRESENLIVEGIKKLFPDDGIYGEEETRHNLDKDRVWYIDPLDGTSNFIRNIPLFGISVGLVENGEPIFGLLYFPALNKMFVAEKGKGAFMNGKKIHVSDRPLDESLYMSGGLYRGEQQLHNELAQSVGLVKIIDSSSHTLAHIACGDVEIYYLDNVPHDVVAGVCIAREAGGEVTDGEGGEWKLDSEKILVTNGVIHQDVLGILK